MEDEGKLIIKRFLNKYFPIVRIKKENHKHFKRGIIINEYFCDDKILKFYIGKSQDGEALYRRLHKILTDVFGVKHETINDILLKHLNIK